MFLYAQARKTHQLQNQNTFLERLAILYKYRKLSELKNEPFRRNPLKISDCRVFSLETSVPSCRISRQG